MEKWNSQNYHLSSSTFKLSLRSHFRPLLLGALDPRAHLLHSLPGGLVSLDSSADRVASSAVTAFTRINSPAEVSKLQRLVSQSCLTSQWIQQIFHRKTPPSLPLPASASSGFLAPPQEDNGNVFELIWYESCVTLLEMTLTTRWAQLQQQYQHHLLHRATITSAASASASGTSVGSSPRPLRMAGGCCGSTSSASHSSLSWRGS
jgi:hypothetical protein